MQNNYYRLIGAWHTNDRRIDPVPAEKALGSGNLHRFHQTANAALTEEAYKELDFHLDAIQRIRATLTTGLYDFAAREGRRPVATPEGTL